MTDSKFANRDLELCGLLRNKKIGVFVEPHDYIAMRTFPGGDSEDKPHIEIIADSQTDFKKYDLVFVSNLSKVKWREVIINIGKLWKSRGLGPEVIVIFEPLKLEDFSIAQELPSTEWCWLLFEELHKHEEIRETSIEALISATSRKLLMPSLDGVTRIKNWLATFEENHRSTSFNLLKLLRFYDSKRITQLLDDALNSVFKKEKNLKQIWLSSLGLPNKSGAVTLGLAGKTQWVKNLANTKSTENERILSFYNSDRLPVALVEYLTSCEDRRGLELTIVFLDDVGLSGGQLFEYGQKFFQSLNDVVKRFYSTPYIYRKVWKEITEKFVKEEVKIISIFAIGAKHPELEQKIKEINPADITYINENLSNNPSHEVYRTLDRDIAFEFDNCEFPARLWIQDYSPNVGELIENDSTETLTRIDIDAVCKAGMPLIRPREKEHWLQFEPYGWKDSAALVTTYFNCPGNTLPLFWGDIESKSNPRYPLFTRAFNPFNSGCQRPFMVVKRLNAHIRSLGVSVPDKDVEKCNKDELNDYTIELLTLVTASKKELEKAIAFALFVVTDMEPKDILKTTRIKVENTGFLTEYEDDLRKSKNWAKKALIVKKLISDSIGVLP